MRSFDFEFKTPKSSGEVTREVVTLWTGQLANHGYTLTSQSEVAVAYHRTYRPQWTIAVAILLFPIGLLALLATDDATITAAVETDEETGGSTLIVNGKGPKEVEQAFEAMQV